jgi:hypothetical protein
MFVPKKTTISEYIIGLDATRRMRHLRLGTIVHSIFVLCLLNVIIIPSGHARISKDNSCNYPKRIVQPVNEPYLVGTSSDAGDRWTWDGVAICEEHKEEEKPASGESGNNPGNNGVARGYYLPDCNIIGWGYGSCIINLAPWDAKIVASTDCVDYFLFNDGSQLLVSGLVPGGPVDKLPEIPNPSMSTVLGGIGCYDGATGHVVITYSDKYIITYDLSNVHVPESTKKKNHQQQISEPNETTVGEKSQEGNSTQTVSSGGGIRGRRRLCRS